MTRYVIALLCAAFFPALAQARELAIPPGFIYLREAAPDIQQDIRYAGPHNFTGKPVLGYGAAECLLLRPVALALKRAQAAAMAQGFSLKLYDCYRPSRAGEAFVAWATAPDDGSTRRFYPRLPSKASLTKGYVARRSAHSRGVAVDLTLVPQGSTVPQPAGGGPCIASKAEREADNSVDMGTAYDCFDPNSATASPAITQEQRRFRQSLKTIMEKVGFTNYRAEWWHYSYESVQARESFDMPIQPYFGSPPEKP
jgi:zinc D-Ala-D-Ala dipeptidase